MPGAFLRDTVMDATADAPGADADATGRDVESLRQSVNKHLLYTVGKDSVAASKRDWLYALSAAVRDRLVERWMDTTRRQYQQNVKRVYYLSMEFLPGRMLSNALIALGLHEECYDALRELGLDFDELAALDRVFSVWRDPASWTALRRQAMREDFGWEPSARRYLDLYRALRPQAWG